VCEAKGPRVCQPLPASTGLVQWVIRWLAQNNLKASACIHPQTFCDKIGNPSFVYMPHEIHSFSFRLGCHNLPRDVGSSTAVPRSQRLCTVCNVGQPGDGYHLVFECQGLRHIRDRYPGYLNIEQWSSSCGRQICMGLPNLSQIVWACIMTLTPGGVRHLISSRWLEEI